MCVNPVLSMICGQNSGENCSTRFRAGEGTQLPPLVPLPDVTLDFSYTLVCCSLKVLPPKEIKETEVEGYKSLKGEGWEKNEWVDVHKKK